MEKTPEENLRITRLLVSNKYNELINHLNTLIINNNLMTDISLRTEAISWINSNTVNLTTSDVNTINTKYSAIWMSLGYSQSNQIIGRFFGSLSGGDDREIYSIISYMYVYIYNNPSLSQAQLNTNIENYLIGLASQQTPQTPQAFTNYSTGIDYSKISVNNRPYSIKQKLTGSPISF